jgi:hypothetical protein
MTALDALERTQAEHHRTAMAALAAAQAALAAPSRRYHRPLGDCALRPRARVRVMRPATEHEVELARVVLHYEGAL